MNNINNELPNNQAINTQWPNNQAINTQLNYNQVINTQLNYNQDINTQLNGNQDINTQLNGNVKEVSPEFVAQNSFYEYSIGNQLTRENFPFRIENMPLINTRYLFDGNPVYCTEQTQMAFFSFCENNFSVNNYSVGTEESQWAFLINDVLSQPMLCKGLFSLCTTGVVLALGRQVPIRHIINLGIEEDARHMTGGVFNEDIAMSEDDKEIFFQQKVSFIKVLTRRLFGLCSEVVGLSSVIARLPKTSYVSLEPVSEVFWWWPSAQVPRSFDSWITQDLVSANGLSEPSRHYISYAELENETSVSERHVPQNNVGQNPPPAILAQDSYIDDQRAVVNFPAPPSRRS